MAKKQVDSLEQMQSALKHAIRDYFLTDEKEKILTIQELSTKMAILHGFECANITEADSYVIHLDEHCKKMPMNYSYKAVFILGMLGNGKEVIPCNIDDMAKWFIRFFRLRLKKKQIAEKGGLFSKPNPDYKQVVSYLKNKVIKSLQREGVVDYDGQIIKFSNRVATEDKMWGKKAKKACTERLEEYFERL